MTSFGIFWRSATSSKPTTSQIWTMPFCRPAMWPNRLATVVAAREQRRVRRDLLDDVALAGAARAEFDEVVVPLRQRDEPHQEKQLEPPRHLGGLVAHAPHHEVDPLVGRELAPDAAVLLEIESRDLDGRELVDPERVLAPGLLVVSKRMSSCAQTPPIRSRS